MLSTTANLTAAQSTTVIVIPSLLARALTTSPTAASAQTATAAMVLMVATISMSVLTTTVVAMFSQTATIPPDPIRAALAHPATPVPVPQFVLTSTSARWTTVVAMS